MHLHFFPGILSITPVFLQTLQFPVRRTQIRQAFPDLSTPSPLQSLHPIKPRYSSIRESDEEATLGIKLTIIEGEELT
jgi:hypothetical protein